MVVAVVGSGFWFLQRQLKPLAWLHTGVEAVARGDFKARVPVVRNDEIGQVAGAFNEMASRVGEMIDDRERLLADVSHELRSPIARMKVALEFVPQGDKRDSLALDLKEMENLIAVLLEREELRSRAGRLDGENVDLDAVVGEVAAAFADQGPGVEFVSGGLVTIHADPALMKLLIQNLVDNAIKFSRPDSRPVVAKLETVEDQVVVRVADDGIGIPAGSEKRLFEPFVKLDRARGHGVGYGIGLNLCQRIVQLHGGTIRLRPREPRGTEAVVTLRRRRSV
jgi:signal transduction histidine kinase